MGRAKEERRREREVKGRDWRIREVRRGRKGERKGRGVEGRKRDDRRATGDKACKEKVLRITCDKH